MNVAGSREFLGRRADVINTAKATGVLSAKFLGRIAGHGGKCGSVFRRQGQNWQLAGTCRAMSKRLQPFGIRRHLGSE